MEVIITCAILIRLLEML